MLIGIDGNEANVEKRVGIGEYAFELLKQFEEFHPQAGGSNFQFQIYLKDKPSVEFPKEREGWHYPVVGPKKLWTQIALPIALFKDCRLKRLPIKVFFSPTHYAPRFSPIPTVISIMDLSYLHFPEMFKASDLYQLRSWTGYSAQKAKRVITISEASKNDIIKEYNLPGDRVVVTYPGIKMQNAKVKSQKSDLKRHGIKDEYILFVGTLQPRKNLIRLIEAHSILVSQYPNISLVIVGKKGWLYEDILTAPKKFGIESTVKFLDFVPDENLSVLYQNARFFILPSLYEGFGLPILEAMANGCPVITSNVSSLPEAGGNAALYVDPNDVNDIADKMKKLLHDENLRQELIKKGFEHVKKFSWEKTARDTLKVLEEVARKY